jgi:quinol monooxygenase YgiN
MTAFNVVRFRVKPGRQKEFVDAHRQIAADWPGLTHANLVRTGDRTYCLIAEWTDEEALAEARPKMIEALNSFRDTLQVLGPKVGVTDPVSGPVVLEMK